MAAYNPRSLEAVSTIYSTEGDELKRAKFGGEPEPPISSEPDEAARYLARLTQQAG